MEKLSGDTIKVNIPGSYLLVGTAVSCNECAEKILSSLKIEWADIKIVRPEDSKGKTLTTTIEQVREAQKFINLTPIGQYKTLIFSDAASMPAAAANALLKTLEEPPRYGLIILQSQSDNLLPTIVSRCQKKTLWQGSESAQETWNFDKMVEMPFHLQSALFAKIAEDQQSLEFLASFEQWAREKMRSLCDKRYAALIRAIINAKRDIRNNLVPRVVLETLILRFIHHV